MKMIRLVISSIFIILTSSSMVFRSPGMPDPQPSDIGSLLPIPTRLIDAFPKIYLPIVFKTLMGYFVSPAGNDNNPGTFTQPWRTIGKAANMVEPGDNVYIRGGVYQEAVKFHTSGTSNAPIHFMAYPGETPIIDGANYTLPQINGGLLEFSGDYTYVWGLEVRYSRYIGVVVSGAHDVVSYINAHHNNHGGMHVDGDGSIIEYSQVWSNDMQNYNGANPSADSTGLTAARNPNNAIIRHNRVFGNWGIGLSTYEANGTIIEDNTVYDNYGPNVYLSDVTNILFQRNFIFASGALQMGVQIGIQVADETSDPPSQGLTIINNIVYGTRENLACWKGSTKKMTNVLIANNTFVNSSYDSGIEFIDGLSYENVRFVNNLTQQDGDLPIIKVPNTHPGLTFSNNLWSKTPRPGAIGPGDIVQDPQLTHTGGNPFAPEWFMLSSSSPARNGALPLVQVTVDYFNRLRLAPPDMGAAEFIESP